MDQVFLQIFNTAITAGWLVLAVLLARLLLKKAPAWIKCALWAIVVLRLVWPFSIESVLSLLPSTETIPPSQLYANAPQVNTGISSLNTAINPVFSETFRSEIANSVNPLQVVMWLSGYVWVLGMVAMAVYAAISYLRIRRRVRVSVPEGEGVYLCDQIPAPFILGIINPKIYLPSDLPREKWDSILAHERSHLARRDHWWKPLGFLLLTVFWFHPLLWVAYILLCRDVELACDERVIKCLSAEEKQKYSNTLLECSIPGKWITACPLAFGETGVKQRIKAVLHYKKPTLWILIIALIACTVLAVGFLTDPKSERTPIVNDSDVAGTIYIYEKDGFGGDFTISIFENGTFEYYVGMLSSHIGTGTWEIKNDKLILYEDAPRRIEVFTFKVEADALVYIAAESDGFGTVDVADGDRFYDSKMQTLERNLMWVRILDKQPDHLIAVDSEGICWRILLEHARTCMIPGDACWVAYYGEPVAIQGTLPVGRPVEYEVSASMCWQYIEGQWPVSGSVYDSCRADIDGDRELEICILSADYSSNGLYHCTLTVWDGDTCEYEAFFKEMIVPNENSFGTYIDKDISYPNRIPADAFAFVYDGVQLQIVTPQDGYYISTGKLKTYNVIFANGELSVTDA